jgi:hypothetical protein
MAIYEQLLSDLKQAMLSRDEMKTRVLRSLKAALLEKEVSLRTGGQASLTDDHVMDVLVKASKQRNDSIEQFEKAGRKDLAEIEREELLLIQHYLPQKLSEVELNHEVEKALEVLGARTLQDLGKVMGYLTPKLKGRADGAVISQLVRQKLQG